MNLMEEVDSVEAKTAVTKTLSVLSESVGLQVSAQSTSFVTEDLTYGRR